MYKFLWCFYNLMDWKGNVCPQGTWMTGRGQAASNWVALLRFLLCRIDRFIWITVPSVVHGLPEQMDFGVHYNFFKCKDISWYTVSLGSMFSCHLLFTTWFNCLLAAYILLDPEYYLIFPIWCRPNVYREVSAGVAKHTLVVSECLNKIADFPLM